MFQGNLHGITIGAVTALALASTSTVSAFELETDDTVIEVYGYGRLDIIYDVDADLGNSISHDNIGLDNEDVAEGHTNLHAFQSRLGLLTDTPTGDGDLTTVIEGDFYGSGGGGFRLRHAYGEWNGILAGQTWTNFQTPSGATATVDFTGQPGLAGGSRQAQLRYTVGNLSMALENPGGIGGGAEPAELGGEAADVSTSGLPDFTIRYSDAVGMMSYDVTGLVRQVGIDGTIDAGTVDDTEFGFGVGVGAGFEFTPGISIKGSVSYGEGIGGYLQESPGHAAYIDGDSVETVEMFGGTLGLSSTLGMGTMNVAYGIADADIDDAVDALALGPDASERFQSLYVNYIWSPATQVTYGVEAGYHTRDAQGGEDGDAIRLQAALTYNF